MLVAVDSVHGKESREHPARSDVCTAANQKGKRRFATITLGCSPWTKVHGYQHSIALRCACSLSF